MKTLKRWCGLLLFIVSVANAAEFTVFANDDYRPVSYKNERGEAVGVANDLLRLHEQLTKDHMQVEMSSWRRAYELALKAQGGIIGLSKTKERSEIFDYSDPFMEDVIGIVVKKNKVFPFKEIADLKGKLVGVANGASYGAEFNSALARKIFRVDSNYSTSVRLKKLLHERIDCAVIGGGVHSLEQALNTDPELFAHREQFVFLLTPVTVDPLYLGFHKSMKMKDFLLSFNKTIGIARSKGLLPNTKR